MGALGNSGDGRTFLNTFKGKFTKRGNEDTEGAVKRTNKNGKEVWELLFDTLSDVVIQEFEKRNSDEYGFSWNIKLADTHSDETFTLTLPYSGRVTMGLFFRLPNTDINKPLTMKLYYFEEEDKTALVIYQGGKKVEAFWHKENQGDMPDLEKKVVNGKDVWDSTERMAFIEKYLETDVKPKMNDIESSVSEDAGKMDDEPVTQEPAAADNKPEWDAEAQCLKMKHTDGIFYQCDEKGVFKRDQNAKMIPALPF